MSKELKLLYIEDDKTNREDLVKVLSDETIDDCSITINAVDTFDGAIEKIRSENYHIIVLDIYKGKPDDNGETVGLTVLQQIQDNYFVPVIFYSGNTRNVQDLKSQVVGVVTKGDEGVEGLKQEIRRLIKFNLPFVKENVQNHLEREFKTYFWDIIHKERDKFAADKNDFSLGYLMLRKFGKSLSKETISEILGDSTLKQNKIHPMEFYLYPTGTTTEYECGEILQKDSNVYVILTPSCDFIDRGGGKRKVGRVLLAKTLLLSATDEHTKYSANKNNNNKNKLEALIESRKSDRYFFLPQTPFIENRIIDFQIKEMIDYNALNNFTRLAKLDSPFAESMISSFIRYYNRIGFPDIDSDLIINPI
jgi:CheY-like chemotaxis protein